MRSKEIGLALGFLLLAVIILLGVSTPVVAAAGDLPLEIVYLFPAGDTGQSARWGDMDGDGDLDLAFAAHGESQVYRNMGDGAFSLAWTSPDSPNTAGLVWGDFDRDGDLDLAAAGAGSDRRDQIFRNDGLAASGDDWLFTLAWQSSHDVFDYKVTRSIAAGDYDGDGDIDLVVGNSRNSPGNAANQIYRNDTSPGGSLAWTEFTPAAWSGLSPVYTMDVAWGDMDGDGDLDLAMANGYDYHPQTNRVYRNDSSPGGTPTFALAWESTGAVSETQSVAWGDYDGDGDLDLAFGNQGEASQVYRNDGPSVTAGLAWSFTLTWKSPVKATTSLAWGDMDSDGDLDLVFGNKGPNIERKNQIFYNDGGGAFSLAWEGPDVPTTDLAVADIDGDGDLDLVTVNDLGFPNEVYLNYGGSRFVPRPMDLGVGSHRSMAWGDHDEDGDLDLAVGEAGRLRTYRNDGNGALSIQVDDYISPSHANSVAWGDMDNDGHLDLAVGICDYNPNPVPQRNRVYRNDGSGNLTPLDVSTIRDCTTSVAWGDYDLDGDLDLAVGNNDSPNLVYDNKGDGTFALAWTAPITQETQGLAWGDHDGDGDLDLAVGSYDGPNRIYRHDGAGAFSLAWQAAGGTNTYSVAWVDYDADDDLDLAVGNWGRPSVVYRNDGGGTFVLAWNTTDSRLISSIAWSDPDGDGDQDMAAGTGAADQGIHLYSNANNGFFTRTTITETGTTMGLTWSDHDGDGDPDLAVESSGEIYTNMRLGGKAMPNNAPQLVLAWPGGSSGAGFYASPDILESSIISIPYSLYDPEGEPVGRIEASYSLNGGGKWHPAVAAAGTITTNVPTTGLVRSAKAYISVQAIPDGPGGTLSVSLPLADTGTIANIEVWLTVTHTRDADLKAVLVSPAGTSVTLFDGLGGMGQGFLGTVLDDYASTPILSGAAPFTGIYRPQDSLSPLLGQEITGTWQLVVTDTVTGETGSLAGWGLRIKPQPARRTFSWDTFASGFFGQSDNVVFRLQAYPTPDQGGDPGAYDYAGGATAPYHWSNIFATTSPFRVRGTQVRVISDTLPVEGVEGAVVYRIPAGQARGGSPLADPSGQPYTTDGAGYLRGHGTVAISDTLVALVPVTATDTYTLYLTNATPTSPGLEAHTVISPGVQTITVTASHPLLLFNLDVSLQWDARNDSIFLAPFEFNLQQTSDLLYDWTDGQAALGRVTVHHNRGNWNDAHLRVYASNARRPSAVQGGIVGDVISDTDIISITYAPGQVHMGAVWNRYGEPGNNLGQDWARTLAHELGHYALFLDDNYLGFDDDGQVVPINTCTGAMADPYRQDYPYDEFHADDLAWQDTCTQTLSHKVTGRPDWRTIEGYYPWLDGTLDNEGPSGLPLEVTRITYVEPDSPPTALEDPTFYLLEVGERVQPGSGTRAFLYQDDWALDLGRPTLDHVLARGASPGDQVCVYEPTARRLGCETVRATDEQLEMTTLPGWQPDIAVSPVNSVTLNIEVTNLPTGVLAMEARLYPLTAPAGGALPLTATVEGFSGTFHLAEPAFEGYVRVLVTTPADGREMITDYAVGGNPVSMRGGRVSMRGGRVSMRGGRAPVMSADGQVILFVDATSFGEDEFYTLQAVTAISPTLPWATVIGQAYRLSASEQAPDLAGASINFSYMADDVPVGGEPWLRLYYWDGLAWQQLPTTLDVYYNSASAPVQGEGLYALMASVEVPLYGPGWNLVSYPLYFTQAVTQAMLSLSVCDCFTTVYGYEATDVTDPWKVYDVSVPGWVNDLMEMAYNHGYWINASATVTWYLPVDAQARLVNQSGFPYPPATYYGTVVPGKGFTPTTGMAVTAWIDDHLCGESSTIQVDGDIVYAVNVLTAGYAAPGCGTPGAGVTFRVGDQAMAGPATWDNDRVLRFDLRLAAENRVYLPLIHK